jgi:O-acetylhomoserine/O-acetylserine sulfhydrylase-like pyridoxal-dependent enzyme
MDEQEKKEQHFETLAIRHQMPKTYNKEHSAPLYMTSSYVFDSAEHAKALFSDEVQGNIYTRYSNPNTSELIDKVVEMEGGEDGFALASGMSAVYTSMMAFLRSGDHVVVCKSVFGSTIQIVTNLFPRWNIEYSFADIEKPETWEGLIRKNTKMIVVETPSNPALDLIDLEWLGKLANKHKVLLNVDNCFATPYLQQPLKYGAHIVTHSATKFIDGQGRALGGLIIASKELIKEVRFFCASYRSCYVTVQCMDSFQKSGNVGHSYGPSLQQCTEAGSTLVNTSGSRIGKVSVFRKSSAICAGEKTDETRWRDCHIFGERWSRKRSPFFELTGNDYA